MTPESFDALAKVLRLRSGPASLAASLVLVEGMRPSEAARTTGCSLQSASNAVRVCRRGIELSKQVVAGLDEKTE